MSKPKTKRRTIAEAMKTYNISVSYMHPHKGVIRIARMQSGVWLVFGGSHYKGRSQHCAVKALLGSK